MTPLRRLVTPLVAATVVSAAAAPAQAQAQTKAPVDPDTWQFATATTGLCLAGGTLVVALFSSINNWEGIAPTMQWFFYIGGGLGVLAGAIAIPAQAVQSGPCLGVCKATYGMSAGALASGGLSVGLGVYTTGWLARHSGNKRRAFFLPMPLVIPTDHGPVPGAGLSGVLF